MYRALYRKWRPECFDDVCGQAQVTDVLKYEVAENKTSHAYLFCGSRGTGKTTCAKILAKAVNCLSPKDGNPCNECEACRSIDLGQATDVVEMDAASNTSVDNVRDIKDEIVFTPASLRYRVYIIDEVHMLSTSAFNALLKTLEEPPAHVIFILATTEMQKLPSTIVSRCQRFDFRRIATDVIARRLLLIADAEHIALNDEGAREIARMAEGGMRDAISLLELCAGQNRAIDLACVSECLGTGSREDTAALICALAKKDYDKIYDTVNRVVMSSVDLSVFMQGLLDYYRDIMVVRSVKAAGEYLDVTETEEKEIRDTATLFTMPQILYHIKCLEDALYQMTRTGLSKRSTAEVALTRMCDPHLSASPEALVLRLSKLESEVATLRSRQFMPSDGDATPVATDREPSCVVPASEKKTEARPKEKKAEAKPTGGDVYTPIPRFGDVIEEVRRARSSIAGFLEAAKGYKTPNGEIMIRVKGKLGANILKRPDTLAILQSAIVSELGENYRLPVTVESMDTEIRGSFLDEIVSALGDDGDM